MQEEKASVIDTVNSHSASDDNNKYLSFVLGKEEYSFEILKVREIIGLIDITPLPQTPAYIKGVINLRGKIIPVVDLRTRFGLDEVEYDESTCIIVVEVDGSDGEQLHMGVIVDTVSEVLSISEDEFEPAPRFAGSVRTEFITGLGKVKDKTIILLDINKVLSVEEIADAKNKATEGQPDAAPQAA